MGTVTSETGFVRYSITKGHNQHEIVMLRGNGCKWRRCRFCDYHTDFSNDASRNFALNKEVLSHVEGKYDLLEVINSGSFCDLDCDTLNLIIETCKNKNIHNLSFECHWIHKELIKPFKQKIEAEGLNIRIKMGVETFDPLFRECYLDKGMVGATAQDIAQYADDVCLLQGIPGQTEESMKYDIETGLKHFKRICVNIMTENSKQIKPDPKVISIFREKVYPLYKDNPRIDILMDNSEWGLSEIVEDGKVSK